MAISISRRERTILIVTVALAVMALVYHLGLSSVLSALGDEREQLRQEKETYERYIADLRREDEVATDIAQLEKRYPMTDQRLKEFTATIDEAFKAAGMTAAISPAEQEEIAGAEDYGFVTLHITSAGTIESVVRVLNYFDRQAILIKELKLTTGVDQNMIQVDVRVSQMIKISEEMKEKKVKRPSTPSGRVVRPRESTGL